MTTCDWYVTTRVVFVKCMFLSNSAILCLHTPFSHWLACEILVVTVTYLTQVCMKCGKGSIVEWPNLFMCLVPLPFLTLGIPSPTPFPPDGRYDSLRPLHVAVCALVPFDDWVPLLWFCSLLARLTEWQSHNRLGEGLCIVWTRIPVGVWIMFVLIASPRNYHEKFPLYLSVCRKCSIGNSYSKSFKHMTLVS